MQIYCVREGFEGESFPFYKFFIHLENAKKYVDRKGGVLMTTDDREEVYVKPKEEMEQAIFFYIQKIETYDEDMEG